MSPNGARYLIGASLALASCSKKIPDPPPAESPVDVVVAPPNALGAHAATLTSTAAAPAPTTLVDPEDESEAPGPSDLEAEPDAGGVPL